MEWVNAVVQGVLLGGLYALFATGLSLAFGVMRLVNLAHGDLSILAAFLLVAISDATGLDPWIGLALVVPAMFVIGYGLQYGLFNRALAGGELAPLLVTFGLSIILQNVLLEVFTADSRGLDAGSIETSSIRITDQLSIGWFPLVTFLVSIALLGVLQVTLSRTRVGRALRATADDARTAQLMGIDNRRIYALGLGSLWGTLVGGIVLGVAQAVGAQISPGWGVLTGHLVFLVVLATRPTGLFARQARQ